ncbi:MAG: glycosyl transferase, partial [Candidatus Korobacteraceae bacterium]
MSEKANLELLGSAARSRAQTGETTGQGLDSLAAAGRECARSLLEVPNSGRSTHVAERLKALERKLKQGLASRMSRQAPNALGEDDRWLRDHLGLVRSAMAELRRWKRALSGIQHARRAGGEASPRTLLLAEDMLAALEHRFADAELSAYVRGFQTVIALSQRELHNLALSLKLVLLEQIARSLSPLAEAQPATGAGPATCIRSLLAITEAPWKELLEPLVVFEQALRQDPAGAYAHMDFESRALYRAAVTHMAEHSEYSELKIAEMALALARSAARQTQSQKFSGSAGNGSRKDNTEWEDRVAARRSHIGYYLVDEGAAELRRRAHVRLPWMERLQILLRQNPDEFYISGIELLTLLITVAIIWRGIDIYSLGSIFFAAVVLLLPCSQSAVEVMNYLVTSILQPRMLPKLDYSEGVPEECTTMVVVPALLLSEKQVRQLVCDLEVRYVGNLSPNLHFAVLTDLPDSAEQSLESDPLVELCGQLIRELNQKYAGNGAGTFAMFHRHRVYNPREGVWMGWERKRGKLLDFNKLILGDYDSFPYKIGELSILPRIRYVLTLDVDTELPRGAAQKLVGTLAHPLCQAIIDPELNIVTQGFGILQPRVGVSVQSAARSRLASIFSGQTGFDLYTRAVSDVYQDLYGEGTFTGKGLYEVRTLHRVLDHRFPRNSLLSHDLIEGAYTRAGLVSDVEVIDKYPSHYSAYIRRKHRWLRGDWQIVEWLFPRVPDESGRRIPNPISLISRWKILDNLRRSVVTPATVVLLLLGWTLLHSSALYWTLVTLLILFV